MVTIAPSSVFSPFGRKATFSTGGEKAFGSALPSNAPRSVGFSLGWRSCQQARRAQMTDEGGRDTNLLGKVTFFPLIRQFSRWSNCHLPRIAASPREKAFGSALPSNAPRERSFPYEGKVARSAG